MLAKAAYLCLGRSAPYQLLRGDVGADVDIQCPYHHPGPKLAPFGRQLGGSIQLLPPEEQGPKTRNSSSGALLAAEHRLSACLV